MPHLSPMNWIMAMLISWLFIYLLSSSNWWSPSNKFPTLKSNKQQMSFKSWTWL